MAVYERNYGRYQGELTPTRSRFLVLPRYAMKDVFYSRGFVAFFALCFLMPFAGLLIIYLHHNISALNFLHLPLEQLNQALPINAAFFRRGRSGAGREVLSDAEVARYHDRVAELASPGLLAWLHDRLMAGDYLVVEDSDVKRVELTAFDAAHPGQYKVDTRYTDFFGRNATCANDSIFVRQS